MCNAIHIDLNHYATHLTIKGWEIEPRIEHSAMMWSTCFRRMISAFLRIFIARYFLVRVSFISLTRPKEPEMVRGSINLFPRSGRSRNPPALASLAVAVLYPSSSSRYVYFNDISSFIFLCMFSLYTFMKWYNRNNFIYTDIY